MTKLGLQRLALEVGGTGNLPSFSSMLIVEGCLPTEKVRDWNSDEERIRCATSECIYFGGINRFIDGDGDGRKVVCNANGEEWIPFNQIGDYTKSCQCKSEVGG